jgi:gluconate 5-dehydrogenase
MQVETERDWLSVAGRRALVVGAGGLGGASAVSLAEQGAQVTVVDVDAVHLAAVADAATGRRGTDGGRTLV